MSAAYGAAGRDEQCVGASPAYARLERFPYGSGVCPDDGAAQISHAEWMMKPAPKRI